MDSTPLRGDCGHAPVKLLPGKAVVRSSAFSGCFGLAAGSAKLL